MNADGLGITVDKIKKWRRLNSILHRPKFFEVDQAAPMKESWLKRSTGVMFSDWRDDFYVCKGHFIYTFGAKKNQLRARSVMMIAGAHAESVENNSKNELHLFRVSLMVHFNPHHGPKKYRKKINRICRKHQEYLEEKAERDETEAETGVPQEPLEPVPLEMASVILASTSEREKGEWIELINFLGKMAHVGTSKLEQVIKKVRIPGVSAENLEMGSALMKQKYEKWKHLHKTKIRLMDIKQPVDCEGFANKIGGRSSLWQQRYFVLKGHYLYYFKDQLGLIFLRFARVNPIIFSGVDMVLRIESKFPRRYPTHDGDSSVFNLSFKSQMEMERWWDWIQTVSEMAHVGRSKQAAKLKHFKFVENRRLYGEQPEPVTGSWLIKPEFKATPYKKGIEHPGYRGKQRADEILAERKRIKKFNNADITVDLQARAEEMREKALHDLKYIESLKPRLNKQSVAFREVDAEDEAAAIEDAILKEKRTYADWKDLKKRARVRLGEKLVMPAES